MTLVVFFAVAVLALVACADDPRTAATAPPADSPPTAPDGTAPAAGPDRRYEVTTTVLESPDHGPQLCLGGMLDSYPPQCGGPDVVGWSWEAVDGWESASGTTWGTYHLVGTWDGERFTLTEPPGPPDPEAHPDFARTDFTTPCPQPPGGWAVVEPATATQEALDAAIAHARAQPDFAGLWLDQSINPAAHGDERDELVMNDPTLLVLNVRFTGDLERHEAELRQRWGGSLCVTQATHTIADLRAVQDELHGELAALWSSADEVTGGVDVGVIVADPAVQDELDRRYGPGVVRLHGALQPVTP
jgi:hypothetical protein